MDSLKTSLMEDQTSDAATNAEEIPDYFNCCVCLDLLYKPIVLYCGHISCFWCVHYSMSSRSKSRCPICRNPYSHFPGVCQMLHFLLLKLYPITYKRREEQILEDEKKTGFFSPEFNGHACESQAGGEFNCLGSPACSDCPSSSKETPSKPATQVESHYSGSTWTNGNSDGDLNQIKPVSGEERDRVSVSDLLCTACKQLLFRPVVLNCGHAYCQTCIIAPADARLRCQVCQCLHPRGIPKICLTLDQFLAANFPKEYALRRDAFQLKQVSSKHERATTCSMEAGNQDFSPTQLRSSDHLPFSVEPSGYAHMGFGCDACGMCPIVGNRYKCMDCKEKKGFDLCGDCYNARPKLPGRFNQRHTPEHKFELIKPNNSRRLRLTERLENGPTSFLISDDASENLEITAVPRAVSGDSEDSIISSEYQIIAALLFDNDSMEDQDDIVFTD